MEAFVVRLWSPDDGREPVLRGTALHVASGAAAVFSDAEGLLEFLWTGLNYQSAEAAVTRADGAQLPGRRLLDP